MPDSIHSALQHIHRRINQVSDTPNLDAQVLLAHIIAKPRAWVLAHPEATLTEEQRVALEEALIRLEGGEPLPYILGHWEFYGLDFRINSHVLIPRPETEGLVERALVWLRAHPGCRRAADVGTGSGCIAISLVTHIPDLYMIASDISFPALQIARANAWLHNVDHRISFIQSDLLSYFLLSPSPYSLDLLCANLPYIPSQRLRGLQVHGREPTLALDGGPDGMDLTGRLLQSARQQVAPGGLMLLEIEATLGAQVKALAQAIFPQARVMISPDLAGRDRLLEIQLSR